MLRDLMIRNQSDWFWFMCQFFWLMILKVWPEIQVIKYGSNCKLSNLDCRNCIGAILDFGLTAWGLEPPRKGSVGFVEVISTLRHRWSSTRRLCRCSSTHADSGTGIWGPVRPKNKRRAPTCPVPTVALSNEKRSVQNEIPKVGNGRVFYFRNLTLTLLFDLFQMTLTRVVTLFLGEF